MSHTLPRVLRAPMKLFAHSDQRFLGYQIGVHLERIRTCMRNARQAKDADTRRFEVGLAREYNRCVVELLRLLPNNTRKPMP